MVRGLPVESILLDNVGQSRLVGEEEGQVRGQDTVLHVTQHLHGIGVKDRQKKRAIKEVKGVNYKNGTKLNRKLI